jgi:homoserine kinase
MTLTVRAPATTANLGSGFDCAAVALDLWNELEVLPAAAGEPLVTLEGEGADEAPRDGEHLALRAFELVAPLDGRRFRFVNRIPFGRGLGSSAATIAAGLVAGAAAARKTLSPDELLQLGLPLEGHADNLAAALNGGVCLTWRNGAGPHTARVATDLPLAAIVVVPEGRVSTEHSRSLLPDVVTHRDAAAASAQAALLGAAIASGDERLLAAAFHDLLHEPYRIGGVPLLAELREQPVAGSVAVTLSGSGPSVVVWAPKNSQADVVAALEERLPNARVLPLRVAETGTEASE